MAKTLKDFVNEALKMIEEVEPGVAHGLVASGQYLVLDVREPNEYQKGHIHEAVNIPRGLLEGKADQEFTGHDPIFADHSRKIMCYCSGGKRGALAAQTLKEMGFNEVVNIKGGLSAWSDMGLPGSYPNK